MCVCVCVCVYVCVSACMCRRIDALVLQECINPRLWRAQREDTLHRQRDNSEKWMKVVFEENMMGLRVSEVSRLRKMMEARNEIARNKEEQIALIENLSCRLF